MTTLLKTFLAGLVLLSAGFAAESRNAGRAILELPPVPGNPRNSEGAFLTLRDGRLLFVYSHFLGDSGSDHAKARLAARHSADAGETWSADTFIPIPQEEKAMNVMSVSLLRMANGDLGLFYLLRFSWHEMRMWLQRSSDDGRTWGEPINCMPAGGYYVVNNDRVIRLKSGRIVIPAARHPSRADRNEASAVDWRGVATFFLSDDDGRTWRESADYCTLPVVHTRSGLQEPGVLELPDGRVWGWARTDLGRQYEMFSADGGERWTTPTPSRFTSPNSPLSIKRIPGADTVLAVWNPAPAYETRALQRPGGDRTPLVFATGRGPVEKWTPARLLDGDGEPTAGYSYTAIHFTADAVLLAYCAGGEADKSRLARLRIRKVPLAALK
ncbi:sialidase family protein [Horticoccus sp. 23ND18S-11]|uniref:sialidase family protein n=1 Tax=Horticoccus sp. 23ND18S-11 TaxID=3391832 RepID=UPI0039C91F25